MYYSQENYIFLVNFNIKNVGDNNLIYYYYFRIESDQQINHIFFRCSNSKI